MIPESLVSTAVACPFPVGGSPVLDLHLVTVWDPQAAYSLARALVIRENQTDQALRAIDVATRAIEKQLAHLDDMRKWAQTVRNNGDNIASRAERMRDELAKEIDVLDRHVNSLKSSRAMMLEELTAVLSATTPGSKPQDYAAAVVEENCLAKQTAATRKHSLQHLRELYGLDPRIPLFRVLTRLWQIDSAGRPLLALLASLARDPLLRATADLIIGMPEGAELQRAAMRDVLMKTVHNRLNESTLNKVIRNAASTWSQSGHLQGRTFKFRRTVRATPSSVSFALYLAQAAGFSTEESFRSGWVRVLDCNASTGLELAATAKRLGLIDLRAAGDVIDLNLNRLDPAHLAATPVR